MPGSAPGYLVRRRVTQDPDVPDFSVLGPALVGVVHPPKYSTLVRLFGERGRPADLGRGALVVVDVASGGRSESILKRVRMFRAQHPGCVIVGRLSSENRRDKPRVIPSTAALRAILTDVPATASEWRSALCTSDQFPEDVARWLRSVREDWLAASWIVRGILFAGESTSSWLRQRSLSATWARSVLRRSGLGSVSAWIRHRRGLDAVQKIQRHPDWTFDRIAYACGFGQAAQVNHLLSRLYAVTPSEVRRTIGWEWLLARALQSALKRTPVHQAVGGLDDCVPARGHPAGRHPVPRHEGSPEGAL